MELNSREAALLLWLAIVLIACVAHPKIRPSLADLALAATQRQLLILFGTMFAYVIGVILLLDRLSLWGWDQLKNVVVWFVAVGIVSTTRVSSIEEDSPFFWNWLLDNLKIIVVLEFIVSFYTFPFIVEFVLQPALAMIAIMAAFAGRDEKYLPVKKLLDGLLLAFGIGVVGYTIYMLATDFADFAQWETLRDFYTPIFLSLAFLPFLWALHVFMTYERIIGSLRFSIKDDVIRRYAKWRAITAFGPSTTMLRRWHRYVATHRPTSQAEVLRAIVDVKNARRREGSPVAVPAENGWSPDRAKHFIEAHGIVTRDYHRLYDEWYASSPLVEYGDGVIPDNIAYYINGDELVATKLRVVLNVNNPEDPSDSEQHFAEICASLTEAAMGLDFSSRATSDYEERVSGKVMSLKTQKWSGGTRGGYEREFTIAVPGSEHAI